MASESTELQALVIKLEADASSFRAEILKGQQAVVDSSKLIQSSLADMAKNSGDSLGRLGGAIDDAFTLIKGGAVLTAAIEAIGEALQASFDAENVRAVNQEFEVLSSRAGLATDTLAEGLKKAAGGLVDDTDLLKLANKAIVEMGSSAAKLPEIMELARKASVLTGGSIKDTFEAMDQAIASGQTRALKNLGIIVDQNEAYKQYAASIGLTVEMLNTHQKQQAILNAVLEQGKTAFNGIDPSIRQNQQSYEQLKATLAGLKESAENAFDKLAGPALQNMLSGLKAMASDAKKTLDANFGDGVEGATAKLEVLQDKIRDTKAAIIDLEQKKLKGEDFAPGETEIKLVGLNKQLQELEAELPKTKTALQDVTKAHEEHLEQLQKGTEAVEEFSAAQIRMAEYGQKLSESLVGFKPADQLQEQLTEMKALLDQNLIDVGAYNEAENRIYEEAQQKEIDSLNMALRTKKISQQTYWTALGELEKKYEADSDKLRVQQQKAEQSELDLRFNRVGTFFGNLSALMKTKDKELFEIGKAAAVAQAIIDGIAAVQKTLAEGGWFAIPLAASIGVMTAANVASIESQHLATGIDSVPGIGGRDQFPALLAPGERVVPAQTNQDLTKFLSRPDSSAPFLAAILDRLNSINFTPSLQIDGREIAYVVRDQVRAGRVIA